MDSGYYELEARLCRMNRETRGAITSIPGYWKFNQTTIEQMTMKATGLKKVLARKPHDVRTYYNRTGRRDKDGKPIFEILTYLDFTTPRPKLVPL